ncbi:MAG: PAS domain-containing sensor histidine kinase [Acidobacteriota bacterium]
MPQVPFRHRLTVRLTAGVILVLLSIGIPFLFAFHRLLRAQQLDALSQATAGLSRVVVDGLRSAMLAGEPHLLDQAVRNLSEQREVERVMLLDHRGRVSVSSDRLYESRVLDRDSDRICRVCHRPGEPPATSRTAVTTAAGRRVLRAVSTIANEPRCRACHDTGSSINGILLMDLALGAADRHFSAGMGSTVALGALMVAVTVAVLVLLLRRMVHNPLRAVVSTSQRIVQGDLDARVKPASPGEFALLASQVNRMTDHLARSLRTVETQRRELQAILDSVDDEIVVLDREQRVVAANRAFQLESGRPEKELTGRLCRDISASRWPCSANEPGGCPVRRVFETGRHHKGIMSRCEPEGGERTIEIHASPLRGPGGEVALAVEVRRDISERRQLEATLAHSECLSSLGLLASGLSHEINNPLAAIATSVDGLRRRLGREAGLPPGVGRDLEQALQRIGRQVERGRRITHGLLKVARPSGGARALVDLNRVVEDVLTILSHQIERSRIVTRLELGESLPPLRADESSLGQVVMNLTLNAVQSMDGVGGELRLVTSRIDGAVRLEIQDTGCGIPAGLLKRVFEPFFTTKPVGRGTGLGLFVTHRIVTEMGGSIEARSRPGQGTRMIVRLPLGDGRGRT